MLRSKADRSLSRGGPKTGVVSGNGMPRCRLNRRVSSAEAVAPMRKVLWRIIIASASMSSMVGSASADPYKWCAVESGGSTNCSFMTIEQCRATISGNGGSCEPKQILPTNLSPAARNAAPKTATSGNRGNSLMECVTNSCRINCSPNIAKRFRPKWCVHFREPV